MPSSTPWLIAAAALILVIGAEAIHYRRTRAVSPLAFGPARRPAAFGLAAPFLRIASVFGLAWSLVTLLLLPPTAHRSTLAEVAPADRHHLLIVLDVSPSMRLRDAGSTRNESRMARARTLVESFLARTSHDQLHTTVVAVYNGAKTVVEETRDLEVLHNLMDDLPMHQAFPSGKTRLLDGLAEAARIAKPWPRQSATLVVISDGDSVPPTGMPQMPPSIGGTLITGVGDPIKGSFIDGHHSRQDGATLRQIATRLGGEYHDGNLKLVPTAMLERLGSLALAKESQGPSLRDLALLVAVVSTSILALLPLALHFLGSAWNPGPKTSPSTISTHLQPQSSTP